MSLFNPVKFGSSHHNRQKCENKIEDKYWKRTVPGTTVSKHLLFRNLPGSKVR